MSRQRHHSAANDLRQSPAKREHCEREIWPRLDDGTWMALWFNQLNFLTLAALAGALWAGVSGRPRTEGALLAVATWAKLSPALILVFAALTGRWRTVRAAAVGAGAAGALDRRRRLGRARELADHG
jgi:hypothetical protein